MFCDSMDGEHYAKLNKPVSERQISYDFTYKKNLMNKITNEENTTTGLETWYRLTVTREQWGGR